MPRHGPLAGSRASVVLIAMHVSMWVVMPAVLFFSGRFPTADVARLVEISRSPGMPYRDFAVEYPPVLVLIVVWLFRSELTGEIVMVVTNAAAVLGTFVILTRGWSRSVGNVFLALSLPMQVFMTFELDALTAMLAIAAIALARFRKEVFGGIVFALSILLKLWPIIITPTMSRRRSLVAAMASLLAGTALWVAVGGLDGLLQVGTYRRATGWHVEGAIGLVLSLGLGSPPRPEQGTYRTGSVESWQPVALGLITLAVLVLVWMRARTRHVDPAGLPATAAVACLLALSPVFSPQYVAWLLPFVAIATVERSRRSVGLLGLGAACFASLGIIAFWLVGVGRMLEVLATGRLLCVCGLIVCWFTDREQAGGGGGADADGSA